MAIVLEPKHIFNKNVERNNDNVLKSVFCDTSRIEETTDNILSETPMFYKETDSAPYRYILNEDTGYTIISSSVESSTYKTPLESNTHLIRANAPLYKAIYSQNSTLHIPSTSEWVYGVAPAPAYTTYTITGMSTNMYFGGSIVATENSDYTFSSTGSYRIVSSITVRINARGTETTQISSYIWDIIANESGGDSCLIAYKKITYTPQDDDYMWIPSYYSYSAIFSRKLAISTPEKAVQTEQKDMGSTYNKNVGDDIEAILQSHIGENGIVIEQKEPSIFVCYLFYTIYLESTNSEGTSYNYLVSVNNTSYKIIKYVVKANDKVEEPDSEFEIKSNELLVDSTTISRKHIGTKLNMISLEYQRQAMSSRYTINYSSKYQVANDIIIQIRVDTSESYMPINVTLYAGTSSGSTSVDINPNNVWNAPTLKSISISNIYIYGQSSQNYPPYDDEYTYSYEGGAIKMSDAICDAIEKDYFYGKSTAVLTCSIDNYYDENRVKVISKNGSDGLPMYFKNNDIVRPKRVKMVRKSDGSMEQEQCDLVEGKIFRVVGVKIKYDGRIMQELTLQEETS